MAAAVCEGGSILGDADLFWAMLDLFWTTLIYFGGRAGAGAAKQLYVPLPVETLKGILAELKTNSQLQQILGR